MLAAERSVSLQLSRCTIVLCILPEKFSVPVIRQVPVPLPPAATGAAVKEISEDTIAETKFQLITMLANDK